jgi:hypothetical protein
MQRFLVMLIAFGLMAGCNSNPDPSFKKSADERQAAQRGDPYDDLSRPPRLYTYSNAEPGARNSVAASGAATLSGTIRSMTDKMSADQGLAPNVPLEKACRPAIDGSLAFQAGSETGAAAAGHAAQLYSALTQCRDQAIAEEQAGHSAARANLLRRFASNSMALVGMSLIAKGDAENGLKIWREGDALIVKDKPGFKLTVQSLRGY